jgi:hypothetical protein
MFFLPSHTSHYLQPLDVGVFHAYKHWHVETVADSTYTGGGKFTKVEFLAALVGICQKTFKMRTITSGFKYTRIIPFNPKIMLKKLLDIPTILRLDTSSNYGTFSSFDSTPVKG